MTKLLALKAACLAPVDPIPLLVRPTMALRPPNSRLNRRQ